MKIGHKGFLAILLTSMATFTWLIYYSITGDNLQPIPPEAERGKIVFQRKACIECHTLFGNGGYSGGDLTKTYENLGTEALKSYLIYPPVISGSMNKKHIQLTEEEADNILAYFNFINSMEILDWPPRPIFESKVPSLSKNR
ncbi:c-type cytochrome [Sporomusa sp.]|uniref:c-type cytochrome n=1 Tax=Sporomusa sp. TaxID=2078658 RepID=UPI002BC02EC7|nr:c-type cytochrome [Sporomusa sp.]HWR07921.1 c-type cytochrome [Sporomusa sp.]